MPGEDFGCWGTKMTLNREFRDFFQPNTNFFIFFYVAEYYYTPNKKRIRSQLKTVRPVNIMFPGGGEGGRGGQGPLLHIEG